MPNLADVVELARTNSFLCVVSTVRAAGTVQSSLVNAGVLADPDTGDQVVGLVTYGPAKLANLRARPAVAVTFTSGWQWATVEGTARIVGPDDPAPGVDAERLRLLLREVFTAAGGTHDDWEAYDRVMARERRAAVFVTPTRIYSNAR
jgi:PPOX class probable F420-dependent enzyme